MIFIFYKILDNIFYKYDNTLTNKLIHYINLLKSQSINYKIVNIMITLN